MAAARLASRHRCMHQLTSEHLCSTLHQEWVVATLDYASGDPELAERALRGGAPQPAPARRLRRPAWFDPRMIIGVGLILVSVAGVIFLLNAQNRTLPVYAADRELSTGTQLSAEDLHTVHVQLDAAAEHYLSAEAELPPDVELLRPLSEGELVPAAALGAVDQQRRQAVTVDVQHALARSVQPGRSVDVWAASGFSALEQSGEVTMLATAAEVTDIRESDATFEPGAAVTVELLVDPAEVPDLLAALGAGDELTVLPAGAGDN